MQFTRCLNLNLPAKKEKGLGNNLYFHVNLGISGAGDGKVCFFG